MIAPQSIRLSFERDASDKLKLTQGIASLALPYASVDVEKREGLTGFWVQLENDSQETIYRLDAPGLMISISQDRVNEEMKKFDVLVPYLSDAKTVAIYGPPREHDGLMRSLGGESILLGRFPLPEIIQYQTALAPKLPADICGKERGQVLSVTNIIYHGRVENIYNLIILGDKFGESEQGSFLNKANDCINLLMSRPPFNSAFGMGAMNVFFVEVASNSKTPSYFNTTFSSGSTLINWDTIDVRTVCDALFSKSGLPFWNWAGIIVNNDSERIGTQRGSQFSSGIYSGSSKNDHAKTFQHEFGHAAFGLLDEYGREGTYTGEEPNAPNITKEHTYDNLKWKDFVTPGVPIPTPIAENDSDVGCYEGGYVYRYGIYRPQYKCVMRQQSDVDGYFCKICTHHATKVVARANGLFIPAPGSLLYSDVSQKWTNLVVASQVTKKYGILINYIDYDLVVGELSEKKVGKAVRAAFKERTEKDLPERVEVFEASYDASTSEGLWYLIVSDEHIMYYIHGFKISIDSEIAIGEMRLPPYPMVTLFDGIIVGTEMHVFCGDNGNLSYGKQDTYGNIEKNFTVQGVAGLEEGAAISGLSVDFVQSRIMVAVVDALRVKIAAYELTTKKWNSSGFITMPVGEGENFDSVRISQSGNFVHVAAQMQTGIYYRVFNSVTMTWDSGKNEPVAPLASYFDICADGTNLYLLTNSGATTTLYNYNIISKKWSNPIDVTASLSLLPGEVITSLSVAVLHKHLHIVVLVNQKPKHAIYNILNSTWLSPLSEIHSLDSIQQTIGAMMVHASSNQLHLTLSNMIQLPID